MRGLFKRKFPKTRGKRLISLISLAIGVICLLIIVEILTQKPVKVLPTASKITSSVSTPTSSTPSKPPTTASPSPSTKSTTALKDEINTDEQAVNQDICSQYYNNLTYNYQIAITNMASSLGHTEANTAQQFEQDQEQAPSNTSIFTEYVNALNEDISSSNAALKSDWTLTYITDNPGPEVNCSSIAVPALVQVPVCNPASGYALTYNIGVMYDNAEMYCDNQVDPNLGI